MLRSSEPNREGAENGYGDLDGDTLLDPMAGWVLERRVEMRRGIMCGTGARETCQHCHVTEAGCDAFVHHEHPLACSDDCENALLSDKRFEHCEPPFGYQRGGPHP